MRSPSCQRVPITSTAALGCSRVMSTSVNQLQVELRTASESAS
jgi:hypothetical protein